MSAIERWTKTKNKKPSGATAAQVLLLSAAGAILFSLIVGCGSPANESPADLRTTSAAESSPTVAESEMMVMDPIAGLIKKRFVNALGMTFVYIPPGGFLMGSPEAEPGRFDHEALHQVQLSRGFYLQITETTQQQWQQVMHSQPAHFPDCPDCPVEQVSWNDVNRFLLVLNRREYAHNKYRLPTEAEWEYACRAGTQTAFSWGDAPDCHRANFGVSFFLKDCKGVNPGRTMEVGRFPPNPWGLFDMHGNVAEWCRTRFGDYPAATATDPLGPYSHPKRIYRGGSWQVGGAFCRSANRDGDFPLNRSADVGFRVARTP